MSTLVSRLHFVSKARLQPANDNAVLYPKTETIRWVPPKPTPDPYAPIHLGGGRYISWERWMSE
jgi:hypothetical protein